MGYTEYSAVMSYKSNIAIAFLTCRIGMSRRSDPSAQPPSSDQTGSQQKTSAETSSGR